ncbi:AP endonuclease family 2 [Penicillium angulare]|uniref:AP endonuclease family 2 n=1 Tax=Penicillium angulare TaxID=116970 RepID=A0A9W9FWQ9_9EURO|nr:AP endonuclease family 2 [Penicillium angulare]
MASNKLAIATVSLGQHPSHSLDRKIRAAAKAGFNGLEIVFSDLESYSKSLNVSILDTADKVKELCNQSGLEILSLAPFENYEGDRSPLNDRLEKAKLWIDIARRLQAPYMQIPSHYGPDAQGNTEIIVSELRQLADLGSSKQPLVSIAYEALSWGTHCSTWEDSLKIVNAVERPNFGLCIDNFHVVTKVWGDAFALSGKFPDADRQLEETLQRFVTGCPLEKIFFIQLSDGEKFDPPFSKEHPWYLEGEAPQFTWSRHARPFPLETQFGAYMPMTEIVRSWLLEKGYNGWVSLEIFDRRMRDENNGPEDSARRGVESWRKLQASLKTSNL